MDGPKEAHMGKTSDLEAKLRAQANDSNL